MTPRIAQPAAAMRPPTARGALASATDSSQVNALSATLAAEDDTLGSGQNWRSEDYWPESETDDDTGRSPVRFGEALTTSEISWALMHHHANHGEFHAVFISMAAALYGTSLRVIANRGADVAIGQHYNRST